MTHSLPLEKLKASIVIRRKNETESLRLLLNSLFEQTEMGFEIILVNNGTKESLNDILNDFPIATLIQIPEGEFSHPLSCNLGMYVARNNHVVLTNAHCLPITRTWLSDGLSNFTDDTVAGIDGNYRAGRYGSKWEKLGDVWQSDILYVRRENQSLTTTNAILRKDLWEKYQFDESLPECEDYDWSDEMLKRGYKTIKDPRFNVYHAHGLTNEGQDSQNSRWEEVCDMIDKKARPGDSKSKVFDDDFWKKTGITIEKYL